MKKKIGSIFMCVILGVSMAACQNADQQSGGGGMENVRAETGGQDSDAEEREVVRIILQEDETGGFQKCIDAFNDSQDQYTAEWIVVPNDTDQMREQINRELFAGSSEYDVMSLDVVWAGDLARQGSIEPLDAYMEKAGRESTDYNKGAMDSGNVGGSQYALPFYVDFGLLFYRSDIVSEQDGAKLESGDYTWDDLLGMAQDYAGQGGTQSGMVFTAAQNEGLICTLNEFTNGFTDTKSGLEMMKTFMDSQAVPEEVAEFKDDDARDSFLDGETVFCRNWPYVWGEAGVSGTVTKEQIGVAPMPEGCCIGGWLLAMNANSGNKDGAWALLDFMTSEEGQMAAHSATGNVPGLNSLLEDSGMKAANELLDKPGFLKAAESTVARPVSEEYTVRSEEAQRAVHKYLAGTVGLDETASELEGTFQTE